MSRKIESILMMSKLYKCRPSELMGRVDEYTAFCFDEACAYIIAKLQNDEKPRYKEWGVIEKHYKNFSDMYKEVGA